MARKNFERWEEAFIYLCNPLFSHKEIGNYLKRSRGSIQIFLWRKGWLKKDYFVEIHNGDEFGSLTVINKSFIKKRHQYYLCECICGNKVNVRSGSLNEKNSTTCGKCYKGEQVLVGFITRQWFSRIKNAALRRKMRFDLDMEFLNKLLKKQNHKCKYTKIEIGLLNTKNGVGSTASLDRRNSTKGYTEDNVQFLHKDINKMKLDFDEDYFIKLCKLVAENN